MPSQTIAAVFSRFRGSVHDGRAVDARQDVGAGLLREDGFLERRGTQGFDLWAGAGDGAVFPWRDSLFARHVMSWTITRCVSLIIGHPERPQRLKGVPMRHHVKVTVLDK